jgi:hypothetical protein
LKKAIKHLLNHLKNKTNTPLPLFKEGSYSSKFPNKNRTLKSPLKRGGRGCVKTLKRGGRGCVKTLKRGGRGCVKTLKRGAGVCKNAAYLMLISTTILRTKEPTPSSFSYKEGN